MTRRTPVRLLDLDHQRLKDPFLTPVDFHNLARGWSRETDSRVLLVRKQELTATDNVPLANFHRGLHSHVVVRDQGDSGRPWSLFNLLFRLSRKGKIKTLLILIMPSPHRPRNSIWPLPAAEMGVPVIRNRARNMFQPRDEKECSPVTVYAYLTRWGPDG
jgi:hypothetical protein